MARKAKPPVPALRRELLHAFAVEVGQLWCHVLVGVSRYRETGDLAFLGAVADLEAVVRDWGRKGSQCWLFAAPEDAELVRRHLHDLAREYVERITPPVRPHR